MPGGGRSEEQVLGFLVAAGEAGDAFVSGEVISERLGLSRAAVWKHVKALRDQGYRIEAAPARGYRLNESPDRLGALELRPLIRTRRLGKTLHVFPELGSTNDEARSRAEKGAADGEVVLAEAQSAGRGRRGRSWSSPPGKNVYLSVILRPDLPPARAPELTLLASVALCDQIRAEGVDAGIKWPNDELAGGRKLAGILTELATDPERVQWVVLGMGVNVNAEPGDLPEELRPLATSLAGELGRPVARAPFVTGLLATLEGWLDRHAAEGFGPVRAAWRERSHTLGREVRARVGEREVEGVAEDIDETGALLVRARGKLERVLAGDVEHF